MNNIIIIPGSFKPPHKGHLSLIERLIEQNNSSKIIVIISKKMRPLDKRFSPYITISTEELRSALIEYFPLNKNQIEKLNKGEIKKEINRLLENKKLKSITYKESLLIWNIYLKYLKKKYDSIPIPEIIFHVAPTNNIIQETTKVMLKMFQEHKKIILMKSAKNKDNKRFDFIEKRFGKYIKIKLFPNIKNIDATDMRVSILKNDYEKFEMYLPDDLKTSDKKKIWKICKSTE